MSNDRRRRVFRKVLPAVDILLIGIFSGIGWIYFGADGRYLPLVLLVGAGTIIAAIISFGVAGRNYGRDRLVGSGKGPMIGSLVMFVASLIVFLTKLDYIALVAGSIFGFVGLYYLLKNLGSRAHT